MTKESRKAAHAKAVKEYEKWWEALWAAEHNIEQAYAHVKRYEKAQAAHDAAYINMQQTYKEGGDDD